MYQTNNDNFNKQLSMLNEEINKDDLWRKNQLAAKIAMAEVKQTNILLAGPTGAGKSSTINALLCQNASTVGTGADPETMEIRPYTCGNYVFWDTPGLGDSIQKDVQYKKMLREKLCEKDHTGMALIDFILLVIDGSEKDLGTVYDLLNTVIIPCIGRDQCRDRVLIAINKADRVMNYRHWDPQDHRPDEKLLSSLKDKEATTTKRISDCCGITPQTICLSAGWTDAATSVQEGSYGIFRMMLKVIEIMPYAKRPVLPSFGNNPFERIYETAGIRLPEKSSDSDCSCGGTGNYDDNSDFNDVVEFVGEVISLPFEFLGDLLSLF